MSRTTPLISACVFLAAAAAATTPPRTGSAARLKDLVSVEGVRSNPLIGYGLVVGLNGTGDTRRALFTNQSLSSLLKRMGLNIAADKLDVQDTAAVMVTGDLPPFAAPGEKVDVTVSAIGNARSLSGGTLLMTPLKGADGRVYALAQGPIAAGGFDLRAGPWQRASRNVTTAARVPQGAVVERGVETTFVADDSVSMVLHDPDFTTADRIAKALNKAFGEGAAAAKNAGLVVANVPAEAQEDPVGFLSRVEGIEIDADAAARVVVNERTGTVVIGGTVTLGPAAVTHGNLRVSIQTGFQVSQPGPLSGGRTAVVPETELRVDEEYKPLQAVPRTTTVDELVKALNSLGASPRDLISILQALKATGALRAELKVI